MVSILAFDTRSMTYLLDDEFKEYFSETYPLFYRNKIQKGKGKGLFYRNSIDSALRSNQVGAVQVIIAYVMKYQNTWVSSFLFHKNFADIIEKGINIKNILQSNVFNYEFDLDEWPSTHLSDEECLRPYN